MTSLPERVERDIQDIVASLTPRDGATFERTIRLLIDALATGVLKPETGGEELKNELAGFWKYRFDLVRLRHQLAAAGLTIPDGQNFPRWRMVYRLTPYTPSGIDILIIGYRKDVYDDARGRLV